MVASATSGTYDMYLNSPPEKRIPDAAPSKKTIGDLLLDALASFSSNRGSTVVKIQGLRAVDPLRLALAAVQLLRSTKQQSPATEFLTGLMTTGTLLTDVLMNPKVLPLEASVALARTAAPIAPRLDLHLMRQLTASAGGGACAIPSAVALRVLGVVDKISDCALLAPNLIQFQRHPCAKVRSKAFLMLGRCNLNLTRVEGMLEAEDGRQRANAVESLWGHSSEKVRALFWQATQDRCSRVVVNALVGLCQAGDREAYRRLVDLVTEPDAGVRSGIAWAMGEIGDPEFDEALKKLGTDVEAKVREMAAKSRQRLRVVAPVTTPAAPAIDQPSTDQPGSDTENSENTETEKVVNRNNTQYVRIG